MPPLKALPLLKALPGIFRQSATEWINDNAPRLGASVAFYSLLSLAPVIVIALALAAYVYGQDAAQGRLASDIRGVAGPQAAATIQAIVKGAAKPKSGLIATLLGLAILTFGASSVFIELHDALNGIWGVPFPVDRSHAATVIRLIKDRFYSFATVLAIGFLLLVSLVLTAATTAMGIAVPRAAMFLVSYAVMALLFAALYKIVPDLRILWSDVALGAMAAALLVLLGTQVMGLYFAHTSSASTYSAAGSPIVVLLTVYYSAQLFFWGAEFSKVYARVLGSQSGSRGHTPRG